MSSSRTSVRESLKTVSSSPGLRSLVSCFFFVIRFAVGSQDVVKPDLRFGLVLLLPGVPWIDRLRLAGDEAPAVGADVLLVEVRQVRREGAADGTCHVFGAQDRPAITLER